MRKKSSVPASQKVSWVEVLPDGGGAWGKGIISTVRAMEDDLNPMIERHAELGASIRAREGILSDAVKRANKEARGLFSDKQIEEAKSLAADDPEDDEV